jgi:hypothetical protein
MSRHEWSHNVCIPGGPAIPIRILYPFANTRRFPPACSSSLGSLVETLVAKLLSSSCASRWWSARDDSIKVIDLARAARSPLNRRCSRSWIFTVELDDEDEDDLVEAVTEDGSTCTVLRLQQPPRVSC